MDKKTRCSFACLAAILVSFIAQNVTAADKDRSGEPSHASTAFSSTVSPIHAVTGNYGLSAYVPPVMATGYAYTVPAYGPVIYYYPPALYSPLYIDPYTYHFGSINISPYGPGHFRFPYYSYRRPWYTPGPPVFNRDTNVVW